LTDGELLQDSSQIIEKENLLFQNTNKNKNTNNNRP